MNPEDLRPKGAIGVYIVNDKAELLLLLRHSAHANETWCPPGGHIEYGESFAEAAKREAKEESGVEMEDIEVLGVTSDVYPEEKRHYITVHAKPIKLTGQPKLMEPDKFFEMKWFKLSDLPTNLFPANKRFLAQNPSCLCGSGMNYNDCHGNKE